MKKRYWTTGVFNLIISVLGFAANLDLWYKIKRAGDNTGHPYYGVNPNLDLLMTGIILLLVSSILGLILLLKRQRIGIIVIFTINILLAMWITYITD